MTLSNILVIDSSFRDTNIYPLNTSFQIPVNAPEQLTDYVDAPLIFFSWTQTQAFVTGTMKGGSSKKIILSSEFQVGIRNYYIGCVIEFLNSSSEILESSKIILYDPTTNTIFLENSIKSDTLDSVDSITIHYWNSISNPFNIQITGYVNGVISQYNHLYLYNRTKNLLFEIKELDRFGLITLDKSMGTSYDLNDLFEIRNNSFHYQLLSNQYFLSIQSYELFDSKYTSVSYIVGEVVYITRSEDPPLVIQTFKITNNKPLRMELLSYGGNYELGGKYNIVPERFIQDTEKYDDCIELSVVQIAATIESDRAIPSPSQYVLYFGNYRFGSLIYFIYKQFKTWIILENFDRYIPIFLDLYNANIQLDVFFLTRNQQTVSSNVANNSFPQNAPCFKIKLQSLILPNKYVKGYQQLLSFFPYVIVKLYNSSSSNKTKNYAIISNNPTSSTAQFFCPIGNLLNPGIIRFVEISSDMTQSLQLSPYDDLVFEVNLPNGKILEFENAILPVLDEDSKPIPNILPNYTLIIEERIAYSISNTVCAIFSIE